MYRKTLLFAIAAVLAAAGCSLLGGGGLAPGDTAEGDLREGVELAQLIPDAERVLLAAGISVDDRWPGVGFDLKASGEGISLSIPADGIDPVIVVVDAAGKVLAVGDDWDGRLNAFVSLASVPDGSRAIVFDNDGRSGAFEITAGTHSRYDWKMSVGGEYSFWIVRDKDNRRMENMLRGLDDLWRDNWRTGAVLPLEITSTKWLRVAVDSDVDCVMAVVRVNGRNLVFVDYDDDTDGMNPVFAGELEPGSYLFIVNTYAGDRDTDFDIFVNEMNPEDMAGDVVHVTDADRWYTGWFNENSMVISYWPQVVDHWGIYPEDSFVAFEFTIEEEDEYVFDATCGQDTKMAIIDETGYFVDYNDDGPEGLDPQLVLQLSPGNYTAIVAPYSGTSSDMVEFRMTTAAPLVREVGYAPIDETFYSQGNIYMSIEIEAGHTWEFFAECDTDLTLRVIDAAGREWFDDDSGGDFNPWMEVASTPRNAGVWEFDVESFSGSGIRDDVRFVVRIAEEEEAPSTSAPIQVGI